MPNNNDTLVVISHYAATRTLPEERMVVILNSETYKVLKFRRAEIAGWNLAHSWAESRANHWEGMTNAEVRRYMETEWTSNPVQNPTSADMEAARKYAPECFGGAL